MQVHHLLILSQMLLLDDISKYRVDCELIKGAYSGHKLVSDVGVVITSPKFKGHSSP